MPMRLGEEILYRLSSLAGLGLQSQAPDVDGPHD